MKLEVERLEVLRAKQPLSRGELVARKEDRLRHGFPLDQKHPK